MKLKDLVPLVSGAAPILGGLLGGPVGAAAASAAAALLGSAFGVNPSDPRAIAAAIQNDPDARFKLAQLEAQHQETLQQLALQQQQQTEQGLQNSRQWLSSPRAQNTIIILFIYIVAVFTVVFLACLFFNIQINSSEKLLIGIVGGPLGLLITSGTRLIYGYIQTKIGNQLE